MNPLTQVKNTQKITAREASLGVSDAGSWHAKYSDSAYVYAGNFAFDLTEGDLLAVFAQYGEIVDVNLVRDKGTGKSRGFAFMAYEDQRSTVLAVDNLNGASIAGRTIKVDHVASYKKKEEEDEEEEQRKREERGVCRAFQRGECTRGASCKFSHDEKRCADTGWGGKNDEPKWGHDKYDGSDKQSHGIKEDGSKLDERNRKKHRMERDDYTDRKKYNVDSRNGEKKYFSSRHKFREEDDDVRHHKNKNNDDGQHHSDNESDHDHEQKADARERKDEIRRHRYDERDGRKHRGEHAQRSDTKYERKNERELKHLRK